MFDEENLISLAIFLSFCLSVHNTYVQPRLWGYVFFAKTFVLFRIILFFSRNFRIFYFAKISYFFAKQIEAKFREKNQNFLRANEMRKRSEMVAKFSLNDFSFSLETQVVISVCLLFISPTITRKPQDRFAPNFDWGPQENHGIVLSLVLRF